MISEHASIIFNETMHQDRFPINMSVRSEPMLLSAYIKDCRMKLWDHAFYTCFRGHDSLKNGDEFVGFNGSDLLVRRVLFRYVLHFDLLLNEFCIRFILYYVSC